MDYNKNVLLLGSGATFLIGVTLYATWRAFSKGKGGHKSKKPKLSKQLLEAVSSGKTASATALIEKGHDPSGMSQEGWNALHLAVWAGDLQLVQYLIEESGLNIDTPTEDYKGVGYLPSHIAASRGHVQILQYLLTQGANPSARTYDGWTIFHYGIFHNHMDIVKYCLEECKMDITAPSRTGCQAVHIASQNGHVAMLNYLIRSGANPKATDNEHHTVIHYAAIQGRTEVIKFAVDVLKVNPSCRDAEGCQPLHIAVQHGHLAAVQCLCNFAVDLNARDNEGRSPIYLAVEEGHVLVLKYLLAVGADVTLTTPGGWSVLHWACYWGQAEVIKVLVQQKKMDVNRGDDTAGFTALHAATVEGHSNVISILLDHSANPGQEDNFGRLPLHFAAQEGYLDILQMFISKNVSVNRTTGDGWNVLHYASFHGHLSIVRHCIKDYKMDVLAKTHTGAQPIHLATQGSHLHVLKFLVAHGADVNMVTKDGHSALHYACYFGRLEIVEFLIGKHKAEVKTTSKTGSRAVHIAAQTGQLAILKYLLSYNADKQAQDNDGWTILHFAADRGHLDIVKYCMEELGLEMTKTDKKGRNTMFLAAQEGHLAVIKYLMSRGANPHEMNAEDWTLLHYAAYNSKQAMAQYCIEELGLDIAASGKKGIQPMHIAARYGHLELLKYFISKGADHRQTDSNGWTILHFAARHNHLDVLRYAIEELHIKSDLFTKAGNTPLDLAKQQVHQPIIDYYTKLREVSF